MLPLPWPQLLLGLSSKKVQGNIYSVHVQGLDESEIGPYLELKAFARTTTIYRIAVDVHHIVNGEHLIGTGWTYETAPCIVLGKDLHQQYHGRFNEVVPEYHGRFDMGFIGPKDKLALYYDMFVQQTKWNELWPIASRIITGSVAIPEPKTFLIL